MCMEVVYLGAYFTVDFLVSSGIKEDFQFSVSCMNKGSKHRLIYAVLRRSLASRGANLLQIAIDKPGGGTNSGVGIRTD